MHVEWSTRWFSRASHWESPAEQLYMKPGFDNLKFTNSLYHSDAQEHFYSGFDASLKSETKYGLTREFLCFIRVSEILHLLKKFDLQKRKTFAVIPPNRVVEVANSRRWVVWYSEKLFHYFSVFVCIILFRGIQSQTHSWKQLETAAVIRAKAAGQLRALDTWRQKKRPGSVGAKDLWNWVEINGEMLENAKNSFGLKLKGQLALCLILSQT